MDWYEEYIEEEIRPLVKLLRDNGVNTTCSCGHDMYVECDFLPDKEVQRLDNLLFDHGYRDYEINFNIKRVDGHLYPNLRIELDTKP